MARTYFIGFRIGPLSGTGQQLQQSLASRRRRLDRAGLGLDGMTVTERHGRRGTTVDVPEGRRGKRPLPEPTEALPGTVVKLDVLAERLANKEQLHHPDDATFDGVRTDDERLLNVLIQCQHGGKKVSKRRYDTAAGDEVEGEELDDG